MTTMNLRKIKAPEPAPAKEQWPGPKLAAAMSEAGVTPMSREDTRRYAAQFPGGPR